VNDGPTLMLSDVLYSPLTYLSFVFKINTRKQNIIDYEYDYSDGSGDEDGGQEEDTMSMDTSSVSSDKPSSSTTTNKKRPYGSMDGKRASGGEPRLSGGKFM